MTRRPVNSTTEPQRPGLGRWLPLLPAVLWMAVIFWLSSRSSFPDPGFSTRVASIAAHLVVFGVLAVLVDLGLRRAGVASRTAFAVAVLAALAYGISDELHQATVPGRTPELLDLIVDVIGGVVFVSALRLVEHLTTMDREETTGP